MPLRFPAGLGPSLVSNGAFAFGTELFFGGRPRRFVVAFRASRARLILSRSETKSATICCTVSIRFDPNTHRPLASSLEPITLVGDDFRIADGDEAGGSG